MLNTRLDGALLSRALSTIVEVFTLNTVIGPSEVLVGTAAASKLCDLSTATGSTSQVTIDNRAGFSIFWCYGTPTAPPGLTTSTGVELLANSFLTLDSIGGLCVWAISGTAQSSGSGTRVTGGYSV